MWLKTATVLSLLVVMSCPAACLAEPFQAEAEQSSPDDCDDTGDCHNASCFCSGEFTPSQNKILIADHPGSAFCLDRAADLSDDGLVVRRQPSRPGIQTVPDGILASPLLI
jgi:hypothetical protein